MRSVLVVLAFVCPLGICPALGAPESPYARLLQRYASTEATRATFSLLESSTQFRQELVVASSGRFGIQTYEGPESTRPHEFVFFDGDAKLIVSRPLGHDYQEAVATPGWLPVQQIMGPWAMIGSWVAKMETSGISPSMRDGCYSASLPVGSSELVLSWKADSGVLLSSGARLSGGATQFFEFSDLSAAGMPARVTRRLRFSEPRGGALVENTSVFKAEVESLNAEQADRLLNFDPNVWHVNFFDSITSNVYSPDGELLYNEDALAAQLDKGYTRRIWMRRGWMSVIVIAILLSGGMVWKRLRRP